MSLTVIHVG